MTSTSYAFHITGMTCGHCARTVERAAAGVAGVQAARVDLADKRLVVQAAAPVEPAAVVAAVAEAGYGATRLPEA